MVMVRGQLAVISKFELPYFQSIITLSISIHLVLNHHLVAPLHLMPKLPTCPSSVSHGGLKCNNVLVTDSGQVKLTGMDGCHRYGWMSRQQVSQSSRGSLSVECLVLPVHEYSVVTFSK